MCNEIKFLQEEWIDKRSFCYFIQEYNVSMQDKICSNKIMDKDWHDFMLKNLIIPKTQAFLLHDYN